MPLKTVLRHATTSSNSRENRRSIMCLHPVKLFGGVDHSDKSLTVKELKPSERPTNRDTTQCPAVGEPVAAPKRKLKRSFSLSRNFRMPKGPDKPREKRFGIGRQGERPQGSCPPSIKPETVQNGSSHSNPFSSVPIRKLRLWSKSFDALLESAEGRRLFEDFLKSEFSQENLQFWVACEEFKKDSRGNVGAGAKHIYEEFVCDNAPRQVNLDHKTYSNIEVSMKNPKRSSFDEAQHFIYQLMARDSFQRFQKTPQLQQALKCVSESPS